MGDEEIWGRNILMDKWEQTQDVQIFVSCNATKASRQRTLEQSVDYDDSSKRDEPNSVLGYPVFLQWTYK